MQPTKNRWIRILGWFCGAVAGILALIFLAVFLYIGSVNQIIDRQIEQLRSGGASQFYAVLPALTPGMRLRGKELLTFFEDQGYVEKQEDELVPGSYLWKPDEQILTLIRAPFSGAGNFLDPMKVKITLGEQGENLTVTDIVEVDTGSHLERFESVPKLIGHFRAGRLRTQNPISLSEVPASLRLAVIAIEDTNFLEHHGVSVRAIVRALWRNLRAWRWVQGGSTLTQQLMKNLFFSGEKLLSRKFVEAFFALVTEARHDKETILEAYLNEVYLGQWSTHEIHGVAEAARYYFNRPISELSLSQSATLVAMIRAPNLYEPRRNVKSALGRRNLVLKKMLEAEYILPEEYASASREPLGTISVEKSLEDIHYFMEIVMEKLPLDIKSRLDNESLTIYVSLNPILQSLASQVLLANLQRLEKSHHALGKATAGGLRLQGALIAIGVKDCSILALQGGRSYRQTQFNRISQGLRQPGSLFKPFVWLAALSQYREPPITPLTMVEDSPFEWIYDQNSWKPRNYDGNFRGPVTVRQVLEESLNVPTARIAQQIGVEPIIETLKKAGIRSELPTVPSVSLGSADVTPLDVAQAFTTIANLGMWCELRSFFTVYDASKNLLYENKLVVENRLPAPAVFQIVDLMKGVFSRGTAKSAQGSGLHLTNFAGKTGTTNEAKDAWFVGFSSKLLVLIWIGYDEGEKLGLPGSVAALPVWIDFMKGAEPLFSEEDFVAPEGLVKLVVDKSNHLVASPQCPETLEEYFQRGTEPAQRCANH